MKTDQNGTPIPDELATGETAGSNGGGEEIRIGDRVFHSKDELVEAYRDAEAHRKALMTAVGRQGSELGELRGGANGSGADRNGDDLGIPVEVFKGFETRFVESPEDAVRDLTKAIIGAVDERNERKSRSRDGVERFWDRYFDKNETHREIEAYVRNVGVQMANAGMLDGMDATAQTDAIANRINVVGKKVFGGEAMTTSRVVPDTRVVTESGKGSGAARSKGTSSPAPASTKSFTDEFRELGYRKAAF